MPAARHRLVVLAIAAAGLTSCSSVADAFGPGVPAKEVLVAYLGDLVRGDCAQGARLTTGTFGHGNGELCGATRVTKAVVVPGDPATPSGTEVVYATALTTSGDGVSLAPGDMTWFYDLQEQPNGSWRIAGGGSGP